MTVGIIGAGAIGSALARTLVRAKVEVTIANSRGPASLESLVREVGPPLEDAAQWATRYIDAVEAAEVDLRELEAWGPETASSTGPTRKQP